MTTETEETIEFPEWDGPREFENGAIVRLRSGSPNLVVGMTQEGLVDVFWYDDGSISREWIPEWCLEAVGG